MKDLPSTETKVQLLIRNCSVVSAGTENHLVDQKMFVVVDPKQSLILLLPVLDFSALSQPLILTGAQALSRIAAQRIMAMDLRMCQ